MANPLWARIFLLAVAVALVSASASESTTAATNTPSDVVVLTDETFEHHTQAATGMTTGDWFVEFYAPWCGHCQRLSPVWEQLATELKGKLNIAKVDCETNSLVRDRFDVRGFPTLKLLSKGKLYDYNGARSKEALQEFALGGFKAADSKPIPSQPTVIEVFQRQLQDAFTDILSIFANRPNAALLLLCVGVVVGVLLTTLLVLCMLPPLSPPKRPRPAAPAASGSASPSSTTAVVSSSGRKKAE